MQTPQETRKATLNEIYIDIRTMLHNSNNLEKNKGYADCLELIDEKLKETE